MTTSNMFTLMLHGTILVLTLITGAVHSKGNTHWSNGGIRKGLGQYQGQEVLKDIEIKPSIHREDNKRFNREYREPRLFPFSTIVQMNEFKRNELSADDSKSNEVFFAHLLPYRKRTEGIAPAGIFPFLF